MFTGDSEIIWYTGVFLLVLTSKGLCSMSSTSEHPTPLFDTLDQLADQGPPERSKQCFAPSDFIAIQSFLLQYAKSQDTFNTYRRECERLVQWSWQVANKSIKTLKRADIEQYISFCQNPPKAWVGLKKVARFISKDGFRQPNPEWRLFVATLKKSHIQNGRTPSTKAYHFSQKALQSLFASLNSLFNFLICENLIDSNPITQIRQKNQLIRKTASKRVVRRLTSLQWEFLIETAEKMADKEPYKHERTLFIVSCLYLMYLRISELTSHDRWQPQMGHFYQDSQENWWFKTVGKGNKERDITVSDAMLQSLKRYRQHRNLTPTLPLAGDTTDLLHKNRGVGGIESTRHIRSIMQDCFNTAIQRMHQDGFEEEAKTLQEATVHWLRHTGISDDINKRQRPISHVREDAGHASSSTTDLYNDAEHQARHSSGKKKTILPDENLN